MPPKPIDLKCTDHLKWCIGCSEMLEAGYFHEALFSIQQALRFAPETALAQRALYHNRLASCLLATEQYEAAEKANRTALEMLAASPSRDDRNVRAHYALTMYHILIKLHRADEAEEMGFEAVNYWRDLYGDDYGSYAEMEWTMRGELERVRALVTNSASSDGENAEIAESERRPANG